MPPKKQSLHVLDDDDRMERIFDACAENAPTFRAVCAAWTQHTRAKTFAPENRQRVLTAYIYRLHKRLPLTLQCMNDFQPFADLKRFVLGKSVSVRVDYCGRRIIYKNNH